MFVQSQNGQMGALASTYGNAVMDAIDRLLTGKSLNEIASWHIAQQMIFDQAVSAYTANTDNDYRMTSGPLAVIKSGINPAGYFAISGVTDRAMVSRDKNGYYVGMLDPFDPHYVIEMRDNGSGGIALSRIYANDDMGWLEYAVLAGLALMAASAATSFFPGTASTSTSTITSSATSGVTDLYANETAKFALQQSLADGGFDLLSTSLPTIGLDGASVLSSTLNLSATDLQKALSLAKTASGVLAVGGAVRSGSGSVAPYANVAPYGSAAASSSWVPGISNDDLLMGGAIVLSAILLKEML